MTIKFIKCKSLPEYADLISLMRILDPLLLPRPRSKSPLNIIRTSLRNSNKKLTDLECNVTRKSYKIHTPRLRKNF